MRPRYAPIALALTLILGSNGIAQDQARLTINDEAYNVPLGKPFAVRIGGKRMTLRIDPQTDLGFDEAGVSFRYPTTLESIADQAGEGVTIWTLQGRNTALMIQRYEDGLNAQSLLDVLVGNIIDREGEASVKRQEVKLTGVERAYQGVQLKVETAAAGEQPATESVQNVFTFANAQGVFALLLQDVRAKGEPDSGEYSETLRLLGESLKTGEEPASAAGQPPATDPAAERREQKR